jgi:transcriptional regulator with XRE-family HTH domain
MTVGRNIRILREKKKITQRVLAQSMGVSRQAICMWETGKRELNLATLNRLAEVFAVPLYSIIGGVMVRKGERSVEFELKAPTANRVALSGDFNSWDKTGMMLTKNKSGVWSAKLSLKPGKYQYKFIVDGQWMTDPANKLTVRNSFGSENSIKEVI